MKKLFFLIVVLLILFISWLSFSEGPVYQHKDPVVQTEFENLYQDIRSKVSTGRCLCTNNSSIPVVPDSIISPGTKGEVVLDMGFLYVCVGDNAWRRAILSTW